jgi:hypothetical protein
MPKWRVLMRAGGAEPLKEFRAQDSGQQVQDGLTDCAVVVVLSYSSIVGQQYQTSLRVEKGVIEIASDGRAEEPK